VVPNAHRVSHSNTHPRPPPPSATNHARDCALLIASGITRPMKLAFGFKKKAAKVAVQVEDDDAADEPPAQPAAKRARPDPPPAGARPQASPPGPPAAEPHVAGAGPSGSCGVLCADTPRSLCAVRVYHPSSGMKLGPTDVRCS
jgi:hypothetical protein